jgi:YD repeat-containing protein
VLEPYKRGLLLRHRHGLVARYDAPDRGGRLRRIEDRNGNAITLAHRPDGITIVDALGRTITASISDGLIRELRDHAGRTWGYGYDGDSRLVEVVRPATTGFSAGTTVSYDYDAEHRLTTITSPNGAVVLVNKFDDQSRVVAQEQGDGTFRFEYWSGRRGARARAIRTTCRMPNGGTATIEHDADGHPTSTSIDVRREAFAAEDLPAGAGPTVPVVTTTRYNADGEAVEQTRPAGNRVRWTWAEKDPDPRNRGNLRRVIDLPADGAADQAELVTTFEHEPVFQYSTAITDPRGHVTRHRYDATGNLVATTHPPVTIQPVSAAPPRPAPVTRTAETTFTWNRRGQLLSMTAIDGAVSTYEYYPAVDPGGTRGLGTATADPAADCGYLARITRGVGKDALRTSYAHDAFGNVTSVIDGKGNPSRLAFDALGRLERITGREPVGATADYRFDANGNEVESRQSFERNVRDDATGAVATATSTIRELREYDVLDRLVARTIVGDDRSIAERWGRDAAGRIVRHVQPSGNSTEYAYDELDRLLVKTFAAGTKESSTHRYAWTPNGVVRAWTDGNGHTYVNRFDGFHRLVGFADPLGTTKTQALDAAGNVVRVTIRGDAAKVPLMEATYHVDEWDRTFRSDFAWHGPDGSALGSSAWAGEPGIVSTVVEYGGDGLPGAIWSESGNVVTVDRDDLGRATAIHDLSGERWSVARDDNGNPTAVDYRHETDAAEPDWSVDLAWDELDRLAVRQVGEDAPRRYRHNAIGQVTGHVTRTGIDIRHLHDGLGRRVGHAYWVPGVEGVEAQSISRAFEFDDTFRLAASTDAEGNRTVYRHDALDRQVGVVYADGTAAQVDYDANGNVVRVIDQNGTETVNRYDAANRLVERSHGMVDAAEPFVERFDYDPVGRLLGAHGPGGSVARTYDSLSRPLTERQGRKTVRFETDAAGNLTTIRYPGGEVVRRRHDVRNRVTAVETKDGEVVGGVRYGPADAVDGLDLGGIIRVACAYDGQLRLTSIEYRTIADGTLVDGFRYAYDGAGRVAHEIELREGPASGSRFTFDAANRPVLARYGVRDVRDPASAFELETCYEYFPEGRWRRRIDRDGRGKVLRDRTGTLTRRNRYRRFGDVSFEHDAAGNVTRKGTDNPGFCLYSYDPQNRLVKTECYDKNLNRTQLIEYFYDALGRLVRKVVTDQAGNTTETTYVWAGTVLLEEYENGVLVRTYVYGLASRPAKLVVDKGGQRLDYVFVHDGRGQASGLVKGKDPNAFAERYGYEITGSSFMKEIDGLPVDLPSRAGARSSFLNAILNDDGLGGLRDWATGTLAGLGGSHIPQDIKELLNSLSSLIGKEKKGITGTLNDQMTGYLSWLGLGSSKMPTTSGPARSGKPTNGLMGGTSTKASGGDSDSSGATKSSTPASEGGDGPGMFDFGSDTFVSEMGMPSRPRSKSNAPDMPFKPDWSLYAADTKKDGGTTGGKDGGSTGGKDGGTTGGKDGGTTGGKESDAPTNTTLTPEPKNDPDPGGLKNMPAPASPGSSGGLIDRVQSLKSQYWKEVETHSTYSWPKHPNATPGTKYVDPDQAGGIIVVRPEMIDMKLNGRKQPVNPNGGNGDEPLDPSTIPPGAGGLDPTQTLVDPDALAFIPSGDTPAKVAMAPKKYVQGHEPGSGLPINEGGRDDTTHTSNTTGDLP